MGPLLCLLHVTLLLPLTLAQEASHAAQHLSSTPPLPSSSSAVSGRWHHTELPQVPFAVAMATTTSQLRAAAVANTQFVGPAPDFAGSMSKFSFAQATSVHDVQGTEIPGGRMQNRTQSLTLEDVLAPETLLATTEIPNPIVSVSSRPRLANTPQMTSTQASEKSQAVPSHHAPVRQSAAVTSIQETIARAVPETSAHIRTFISDSYQPSGTTGVESRFLDRTVVLSLLAVASSEKVAASAMMSSVAEHKMSPVAEHQMSSATTQLGAGCSSACHPAALLSTPEAKLPSEHYPQSTSTNPTALFTSMPTSGASDSVLSLSASASKASGSAADIPPRHPHIPHSEPPPLVELASSGHGSYEALQPYLSTPVADFHHSVEASVFRSSLFTQSSALPSFEVHLFSIKSSSVSSVVVTPRSALPPLVDDLTVKDSWHAPVSPVDFTSSSLEPSETFASVTRAAEASALSSSAGTVAEVLVTPSALSSSAGTIIEEAFLVRTTSVPESRGLPLLTASAVSSSIFPGSTNPTLSAATATATTTFTTRVIATPASRSSTVGTISATTLAGTTTATTATRTSTTSATTTMTLSVSSNATRTSASRNITAATTTHPRHVSTRTLVRDARYLFKLSGDCHLIINNTEYFQRFLAGFHDLLTKQLHIREDIYRLGDVTCGSVHVYVTFVQVPMPQFDSLLQAAVRSGGEDLIVPVWMESHFVTFQLVHVQEVAFKSTVETYNIVSEVMDEVDVIVIVVACCVCAVLVTIGIAICVKECYRRKHAQSFDLLEVPHVNLKLEDFTLTRIPRPRTIYTEGSAVKVKAMSVDSGSHNGHRVSTGAKGQVKPTCVINPEDIQVRMTSNSEGIIVGITCHPSTQTSSQPDTYPNGTSRKSKCKNRNPSGDKRDEDHQASEKLLGSRCHGDGDGTTNPVFVDDHEEGIKDTDNGEDSD